MKTQVAIVGASLSGATLALELASMGVSCVLVDKETFPRRKACGEGMSRRGYQSLSEVVGEETLSRIACGNLRGYAIESRAGRHEIVHDRGVVGVRRAVLDALLVDLARGRPCVTVLEGEALKHIERSHRSTDRLITTRRTIDAECVVAADGGMSTTLRRLGFVTPPAPAPRIGSSSYWGITKGTPPSFVEAVVLPQAEVFVTPVGGDGINVSLLGSRLLARLCEVDSHKVFVAQVLDRLGIVGELLDPPVGAGPVNSVSRGGGAGGIYTIGDACETFDPVGGMGMTHAILSARLVARHISAGLRDGAPYGHLDRYVYEREKMARELRGFTRLTKFSLGTPYGRAFFPIFSSTGVASRFSHAIHGAQRSGPLNRLLALCGR